MDFRKLKRVKSDQLTICVLSRASCASKELFLKTGLRPKWLLGPLPADACRDSGMGPTEGSLGHAGCSPVTGAGGGGAADGRGGSCICCCCCRCCCARSDEDPLAEEGMEEAELAVVVTEALLSKKVGDWEDLGEEAF